MELECLTYCVFNSIFSSDSPPDRGDQKGFLHGHVSTLNSFRGGQEKSTVLVRKLFCRFLDLSPQQLLPAAPPSCSSQLLLPNNNSNNNNNNNNISSQPRTRAAHYLLWAILHLIVTTAPYQLPLPTSCNTDAVFGSAELCGYFPSRCDKFRGNYCTDCALFSQLGFSILLAWYSLSLLLISEFSLDTCRVWRHATSLDTCDGEPGKEYSDIFKSIAKTESRLGCMANNNGVNYV